ncbi:MAG TPA: alkaline phosphatase PhoX [Thermoanaerobaculia bacterium]|nr:alkaline phosphatase PhoX [Thermoanaerobaculia bacterium]
MRISIHSTGVVLAAAALAASAAVGRAEDKRVELTAPGANPKVVGATAPSVLIHGLGQTIVAQGNMPIENGTAEIPFYGYYGDGPLIPAPGDVQSASHKVEASKSEPDKNTYLVMPGLSGPTANYDYGTHFLFQGHELAGPTATAGTSSSYITRVNLDADGAHRVTLMATTDTSGKPLQGIDGSTWDPWAGKLLFTVENGINGTVYQMGPDYPTFVEDLAGLLGRAGYEGIQNDSDGNIWIVEDSGGGTGKTNSHAKQPNSFLYRFVPKDRTNLLLGGKLQALQVTSLANAGQPIAFHSGQADQDILSQDVKDLHSYGKKFSTKWITIHDTDIDGTNSFDANGLAKSKNCTPFKRPENGQFRPGSGFTQFFFDETGDTNASTEAGAAYGGLGSILKLSQANPSADNGFLTLFFLCDVAHSGLDNVGFWDADHVVFVEDAGDGLHTQRNALDSAYLFDVTEDYSSPQAFPPIRLLAEGRDPSATIDSALSGQPGFQNEGDNEITGFHVSDGDPTTGGILGAKVPTPFQSGWRVFYTQQHGDNMTWEIVSTDPDTCSGARQIPIVLVQRARVTH